MRSAGSASIPDPETPDVDEGWESRDELLLDSAGGRHARKVAIERACRDSGPRGEARAEMMVSATRLTSPSRRGVGLSKYEEESARGMGVGPPSGDEGELASEVGEGARVRIRCLRPST